MDKPEFHPVRLMSTGNLNSQAKKIRNQPELQLSTRK